MAKRMTALLLAAALLCTVLAGCSKKEGGKDDTGKIPGSNSEPSIVVKPQSNEEKAANTAKYAYQAEYYDLPSQINWLNRLCAIGDKLYYTASIEDGEKTESYTWTDENGEEVKEEYTYTVYRDALFVTDVTSGETTELTAYQKPTDPDAKDGEESGISIYDMRSDSDGTLWILCSLYSTVYNLPENFDPETDEEWNYAEYTTKSILQHINDTGETIGQFTIETEKPEDQDWYNEITNFIVGKDLIYATDYQFIYLIDKQGTVVGTIDNSETGGNLAALREDKIGIGLYEYDEVKQTGGYYFIPIDTEAKALSEEKIKLDADAWNIFPGDDVYDFYYDFNGNVFGYVIDGGKKEKVVDWLECDVDSNDMNGYFVLSDGRVAAALSHWDNAGGSSVELVVLNRVEASQVHNKTVLTLACMGLDWDLRSRIVEYNKNSEDTRIVVKDYSEYSTEEDYYAGLEKLNVEILSGVIPDMFWTSSLPMRQYAAKGVIADLYPLIDADPDFTRESFLPQVLKVLETDGKLYQIPQNFYISSAFGLDRVVGEYDTWTLADLADAMTKLREDATVFDQYYTKDNILTDCIARNLDTFVDWQNGKVNFDSDSFIALLEFANSFPDEYIWDEEGGGGVVVYDTVAVAEDTYEGPVERMRSGKQLLSSTSFGSFSDYIWTFYGGEFNVVGYPMEDGTFGSSFQFYSGMAISSTCERQDLAWDFISSMLTEQAQSEAWNFPVNQKAFDKMIEDIMTEEYFTDENGEPQDWDGDGEPDKMSKGSYQIKEPDWDDPNFNYNDCYVEVYALTQEEVNFVLDVINKTTHVSEYDQDIMDIVNEEVGGYFAGDKTAQEVAAAVQSRAGLYVMERS